MVDSKNLTDEELAEKQEFDENDRREAAEVDNCEYLINPDPYDEHSFLLSYAHKDGWTWMKHPDNPFKIKDMMRWKQKSEKLDETEALLQLANNRCNTLVATQTKALTLIEAYCDKCILTYHGDGCLLRNCEYKPLRETLETQV